MVCQEAVLVLQVLPVVPVELAGRSELDLLDDDQLATVGYGLDVPEAAFLVSVAEVVPQGGYGRGEECLRSRVELRHLFLEPTRRAVLGRGPGGDGRRGRAQRADPCPPP